MDVESIGDAGELERARAVLLGFAAVMSKWEQNCAAQGRERPIEQLDRNEVREALGAQRAGCEAIFERFCTDRPRGNGRPGVVRYAEPSDYESAVFRVEHIAFNQSRRIVAETADTPTGRFRFTLVKKNGGWRVDQRELWVNGEWGSTEL
jgi:hypothetical protein